MILPLSLPRTADRAELWEVGRSATHVCCTAVFSARLTFDHVDEHGSTNFQWVDGARTLEGALPRPVGCKAAMAERDEDVLCQPAAVPVEREDHVDDASSEIRAAAPSDSGTRARPRKVAFVSMPGETTSLPGQPTVDSDTRETDVCELCQQPGHRKEQCEFYVPTSSPKDPSPRRVRAHSMGRIRRGRHAMDKSRHICYQCHQMGHWKQDCPENPDRDVARTAAPASQSTSADSLVGVRSDADRFNKPLPVNIDITIPGIAKAWEWFQRVDADESGRLDLDEVMELASQLGLKWTKRKMVRAYEDMTTDNGFYTSTKAVDGAAEDTPSNGHGASFHDFAQW